MEHTTTGTEVKILLDLEVEGTQLVMADYDFTARFFTYSNRYVDVAKSDMVVTDDGCYIAIVDTSSLGEGEIKMEVAARIPDNDTADGFRIEKAIVRTGVYLKKTIYGMY